MESKKVYNTHSKRYLQIGGQQYKKLLNDGYSHQGDQLIPPQRLSSPSIKKLNNTIAFTGLPDTDRQILHQIDNIYHICHTNKYLYKLCMNDAVLKKKLLDQKEFINTALGNIFKIVDNRSKKLDIKLDWLNKSLSYKRTGDYLKDGTIFIHRIGTKYYISPHQYKYEDAELIRLISKKDLHDLLFNILIEYPNIVASTYNQ